MDDRIYARYMSDVAYFLSKLEAAPDSYYFIPIALAYNKLEKFDETISICRKGLEHFPSNCPARVLLAEAYLYKGDTDQARDILFDVLMEDGDNYKALKLLGIIYHSLEMNDEAIKYLRGAYIRSPEDIELKKLIEELGASVEIDDIINESTGSDSLSAEEEDEEAKTFLEIEQKIKNAELVMADLVADKSIMGPRGNDEATEERNTLTDDELENLISQARHITYTPSIKSDDDNSTFFDTSHLFGNNDATLHGDNERAADVEDIVAQFNNQYGDNSGIPDRATTPEDVDAIIAAFQNGNTDDSKPKAMVENKKTETATSSNMLSDEELTALLNSPQAEAYKEKVAAEEKMKSNMLSDEELSDLFNSSNNNTSDDDLLSEVRDDNSTDTNDLLSTLGDDNSTDTNDLLSALGDDNSDDTNDLLSALDDDNSTDANDLLSALSDDNSTDTNDLLSALGDDNSTDTNDLLSALGDDSSTDTNDLLSALGDDNSDDTNDLLSALGDDNSTDTNDLLSALGDDNSDDTNDLLSALGDDNSDDTNDLLSALSDDNSDDTNDLLSALGDDNSDDTNDLLSALSDDNFTDTNESIDIIEELSFSDNKKDNNITLEYSLEDMIGDDEEYISQNSNTDEIVDNSLEESAPFIQSDILEEIYESSKIDEEIEKLETVIVENELEEIITKDSLKEIDEYRSLKERQVDILEETLDKIRKKAEK